MLEPADPASSQYSGNGEPEAGLLGAIHTLTDVVYGVSTYSGFFGGFRAQSPLITARFWLFAY